MRKLFIIDSDALPSLGPISTRYQWCCDNGCGQCNPALVEFRVSHMTCNGETTHEVTEPRMVSSCCGEGMFLWDSGREDDGPAGFNGELANPKAQRAVAQEVPREVLDAIRAAGMQLLKGAAGFTLEKAVTGIAQPAAPTTCGADGATSGPLPVTTGAGSVTAGPAPAYRLLQRGVDTIQATDEFLADDVATWKAVGRGIFVGMTYIGGMLPARRAIETGP